MEVVIKGTEKEIAAFVAELQKQQERVETHKVVFDPEVRLTGGTDHVSSALDQALAIKEERLSNPNTRLGL